MGVRDTGLPPRAHMYAPLPIASEKRDDREGDDDNLVRVLGQLLTVEVHGGAADEEARSPAGTRQRAERSPLNSATELAEGILRRRRGQAWVPVAGTPGYYPARVQPYSVNVLLATVITVSYSLQL